MTQQEMSDRLPPDERDEPVPVLQELYDNIWLLFLVSSVIILVSYVIWAMIDLVNIPVAP